MRSTDPNEHTPDSDLYPELEYKDSSVSVWKEHVLAEIKMAIERGEPTYKLSFLYGHFPPEHIKEYLDLQEKIAVLIPNEHERPTIDLKIVGKNRPYKDTNGKKMEEDKPDLGLFGGTGPLSDAHIINKLVNKIGSTENGLDNIHIRLRSSPPPRPVEKQKSLSGYLSHMWNYLNGVRSHGHSLCNHYAMLSNTAHANATKMQRMLDKPDRLVHLVDHMASSISKEVPAPTKVLVLGTLEAAEKRLYPKSLRAKGIDSSLPHHADQVTLQHYINHIKSGTLTPEIGNQFVDLIFNEMKKVATHDQPSHVVFGCTEIPLFMETKIDKNSDKTYHDLLMEKMAHDPVLKDHLGVKFVDTEASMVNILHAHQQKVVSDKIKYDGKIEIGDKKIENNDDAKQFKKGITESLDKYLYSLKGLFFRSSENSQLAFALIHKLNHAKDHNQVKEILKEIMQNQSLSQNSTLKAAIVEGIVGKQSKAEQQEMCAQIAVGNFAEVSKQFMQLPATSGILEKAADIQPGDIRIQYETSHHQAPGHTVESSNALKSIEADCANCMKGLSEGSADFLLVQSLQTTLQSDVPAMKKFEDLKEMCAPNGEKHEKSVERLLTKIDHVSSTQIAPPTKGASIESPAVTRDLEHKSTSPGFRR